MKNPVKRITIILIILAVVIGTVGARSNLYLNRHSAYLHSGDDSREVVVEYCVVAKQAVDSLGVYQITIKNSNGTTEKNIYGSVQNGLVAENKAVHDGKYAVTLPNRGEYYAEVTLFAGDSSGYDYSDPVVTDIVTVN